MPQLSLANYLRTERLRSGLTQREVGELLGVSRSVITKAEGDRPPSLQLLLMTEVMFGTTQRELFPGLYARLERRLILKALAIEHRLIGKDDPVSRRKCAFLGELIKRAQPNHSQS